MARKTDEIHALMEIFSTFVKFDDAIQKRIISTLVSINLQPEPVYSEDNLKDSVKTKPAPRRKRRIRSDTTAVPKKRLGRPTDASKKTNPENKE